MTAQEHWDGLAAEWSKLFPNGKSINVLSVQDLKPIIGHIEALGDGIRSDMSSPTITGDKGFDCFVVTGTINILLSYLQTARLLPKAGGP